MYIKVILGDLTGLMGWISIRKRSFFVSDSMSGLFLLLISTSFFFRLGGVVSGEAVLGGAAYWPGSLSPETQKKSF
jgi:hypothetical protein